MFVRLPVSALILTLLTASAAATTPADPDAAIAEADARRALFTIEGQFGLGSPIGMVGGTASIAVLEQLDWSVSVGQAYALDGMQLATMLRLHPGVQKRRRFVGVGVSQGFFDRGGGWGSYRRTYDDARWLNVEVGTENGARGLFSRLSVGVTYMFDYSDCTFQDFESLRDCRGTPGEHETFIYPYLSLSFGYRH